MTEKHWIIQNIVWLYMFKIYTLNFYLKLNIHIFVYSIYSMYHIYASMFLDNFFEKFK